MIALLKNFAMFFMSAFVLTITQFFKDFGFDMGSIIQLLSLFVIFKLIGIIRKDKVINGTNKV